MSQQHSGENMTTAVTYHGGVCLDQGELEGGRNWLQRKIQLIKQNTEHA